jgi:hypothetical protein
MVHDPWRASSAQHFLCFEQGPEGRASLWIGLTDKERREVSCKTVEHLKERGGRWKLNEELESPVLEAHSAPSSFTEAHVHKKDS